LVELGKKDIERIAWVKSFKSGIKWFLKLRKQYGDKLGTQKNYAIALQRFCEYMKMNPDEIIAAYTKALDTNVRKAVEDWNDHIDIFVPWIIDKYQVGRVRASSAFCAIKSFFEYNVSIGLSAKMPESHSVSLLPVTIDELRDKVFPFADIAEKFIISFLKDSGVSQAEVLTFNVGDIKDLGNGFGYMRVFRKKVGVDYETFIGPNTTNLMRKYIDYRKRHGYEVNADSPLFVKKNRMDERLTAKGIIGILLRLSEKVDVKISSHRLRKTFETFLALGKVHPIILKYWMGHKVKGGRGDIEGRYIIPPTPAQQEAYMEAYKHIDIDAPQLSEDERRVRGLIDNARLLGIPEDQIEMLLKERGKTWRTAKELITVIRQRAGRPKPKENADCADGKHCPTFKEIGESELIGYLQDGWTITHNLHSGRVIVSVER